MGSKANLKLASLDNEISALCRYIPFVGTEPWSWLYSAKRYLSFQQVWKVLKSQRRILSSFLIPFCCLAITKKTRLVKNENLIKAVGFAKYGLNMTPCPSRMVIERHANNCGKNGPWWTAWKLQFFLCSFLQQSCQWFCGQKRMYNIYFHANFQDQVFSCFIFWIENKTQIIIVVVFSMVLLNFVYSHKLCLHLGVIFVYSGEA